MSSSLENEDPVTIWRSWGSKSVKEFSFFQTRRLWNRKFTYSGKTFRQANLPNLYNRVLFKIFRFPHVQPVFWKTGLTWAVFQNKSCEKTKWTIHKTVLKILFLFRFQCAPMHGIFSRTSRLTSRHGKPAPQALPETPSVAFKTTAASR